MLERSKSIRRKSSIDLDIYLVYDNIYISSGQAAYNLSELKKKNITHVVNAAPQVQACPFETQCEYYKLNILDSINETLINYFEDVNKFIHNAIQNNGNVLIHCHEGISRAPTICAGYLIEYHNFKHDQSLQTIKQKKKNINPNKGFENQLEMFYKKIQKKNN